MVYLVPLTEYIAYFGPSRRNFGYNEEYRTSGFHLPLNDFSSEGPSINSTMSIACQSASISKRHVIVQSRFLWDELRWKC